jgi:hypothetical protein
MEIITMSENRSVEPTPAVQESSRHNKSSTWNDFVAVLRGPNRSIAIAGTIAGVLLTALLVGFVVQFARAEDLRTALEWAVWLIVGVVALALIKIWFWIQIERDTILRELQRLERSVDLLVGQQQR